MKKSYWNVCSIIFVTFFFAQSLAFADGPPSDDRFKNAEYPYAQAPDGCSGYNRPSQVRDTWGSVRFTEVCNAHDRCFYTYGSDLNKCNQDFFDGLRAACERDVPGIDATPISPRIPEPVTLAACYQVASGYASAVVAFAGPLGIFDKAQKLQKEYDDFTAGYRASQTSTVIHFCNQDPVHTISVAMSDYKDQWLSHGWYNIDPSSCFDYNLNRIYEGPVYIYGQSLGGRIEWSSNAISICIDPTNAFTLQTGGTCAAPFKVVGTNQLSVKKGFNSFSFAAAAEPPPPQQVPAPVLELCNHLQDEKINVAYADADGQSHRISRGWWTLEAGECKSFTMASNNYGAGVYAYAEVASSGKQSLTRTNEAPICIDTTNAFQIDNGPANSCSGGTFAKVYADYISFSSTKTTYNFFRLGSG